MEKIRKITGQLFKKSFWFPLEMKDDIEREAKKNWNSESELARHIFRSWFETNKKIK